MLTETGCGVVPFSIIKWSPFQLSRFKRGAQSGPLFDQQMVPFSIDKNMASSGGQSPSPQESTKLVKGQT
jgi:hypothetical protein